ncbi:hypothetical protein F5B20DRAFT_545863 [Whalleya microplaca]|nr:hypothetical protein F5B20DRAFT_545863 [Whalleya microplaca]
MTCSITRLAVLFLANGIAFAAAADYVWTFTWTGSQSCPQWPCTYSYNVSGPVYTSATGPIPSFNASCAGTVDQPVQECELSSWLSSEGGSKPTISGNFSTFETSGVGAGVVAITATWFSEKYSRNLSLTGSSPLQVNDENHGTWDIEPTGCPLTTCLPTNATMRRRRGRLL